MPQLPIHIVQIPNPFFEGRNRVYVIPSDPVTLIDTGIATQRAWEALVKNLAELGLRLRDVGRVILTHKHIDHIGNAWRIQKESNAEILIYESEAHAVVDVDPAGLHFRELVLRRLREWQVPEAEIPAPSSPFTSPWEIESATATGIVEGQRIDLGVGELEVLHTPGHTLGSVCLKYGRQLFSGDHVLPDISPNVGGGDLNQQGLLDSYLTSLRRTASLSDEIDQVLPGHGDPFAMLQYRCEELIEHHHMRLRQFEALLSRDDPQSVYRLAQELFGELRDFHIVLGCAEAQAHLEYLVDRGKAICQRGEFSLP